MTKLCCHITGDWESRWVESTSKGAEQGKFVLSAGKFYGDAEKDKGKDYNIFYYINT